VIEAKSKKYLLGKSDEIEAERFEEELSADENLFEEFCLAESELIDDYLAYRLSSDERRAFETNYLTTETRREKLETARNFLSAIKEDSAKSEKTHGGFFTFLENQLLWRFAFGGLLVLILLGAVYFLDQSRQKNEIAKLVEPVKEIVNETERKELENVQKPSENVGKKSVAEQKTSENKEYSKIIAENKPTVAAKTPETNGGKMLGFVLLPETLRSEGEQFIKFPKQISKVKLKLELPAESEKYESYQVTLKNAEGETISKQTDLKDTNVTLPTEKLQKQTYILYLEGKKAKNSPESIAEFTFRVRR